MNRYAIPLIAIPTSLREKLDESGHWQTFYESCSRHGTEIWLLNSKPISPELKQLRNKVADTLSA